MLERSTRCIDVRQLHGSCDVRPGKFLHTVQELDQLNIICDGEGDTCDDVQKLVAGFVSQEQIIADCGCEPDGIRTGPPRKRTVITSHDRYIVILIAKYLIGAGTVCEIDRVVPVPAIDCVIVATVGKRANRIVPVVAN